MHGFELLPHIHAVQWIAPIGGAASCGFLERENSVPLRFQNLTSEPLVPTDDGSLVSTRDGRADAVVAVTDPDFQKRLPSFVGAAVGVIETKARSRRRSHRPSARPAMVGRPASRRSRIHGYQRCFEWCFCRSR